MNTTIIKKIRDDRGISQQIIASILNVSRPTYQLMENGEKELTVPQIKILCDYYLVSFQGFINDKIIPQGDVILEEKDTFKKTTESVRLSIPQEKVEVFKEVLLYILNKVGAKPNVGQTVLYKLLYFIDFDWYEKYETQLIGARYIKNHYGPTPVAFGKIVDDMKKHGEIEEVKSTFFTHLQTKYLPRREANLSVLKNAEALHHIDEELARLSDKTAKELSDLSHKDIPWISAKPEEALDYEAVFYRTPDTSVRAYDDTNL
jgi:transcriptional regulator with XRE-family HTH domain